MEMELSCAVTEGLQVAGSASLDEKVFRQLFMHALKSIIDTEAIQDEGTGVQFSWTQFYYYYLQRIILPLLRKLCLVCQHY